MLFWYTVVPLTLTCHIFWELLNGLNLIVYRLTLSTNELIQLSLCYDKRLFKREHTLQDIKGLR